MGAFKVLADIFEEHMIQSWVSTTFVSHRELNRKDWMPFDPLTLDFLSFTANFHGKTAHGWGLVFFLGCQSSWHTASESQSPPRCSVLACPHCLAGDRSDTETNTCSSEEGDLVKCWPFSNPPTQCIHNPQHTHACISPLTWSQTLRCCCQSSPSMSFSLSSTPTHNNSGKHHKLNASYTNTPGILNPPGHLRPCRCFRLQLHLWSGWICNTP